MDGRMWSDGRRMSRSETPLRKSGAFRRTFTHVARAEDGEGRQAAAPADFVSGRHTKTCLRCLDAL